MWQACRIEGAIAIMHVHSWPQVYSTEQVTVGIGLWRSLPPYLDLVPGNKRQQSRPYCHSDNGRTQLDSCHSDHGWPQVYSTEQSNSSHRLWWLTSVPGSVSSGEVRLHVQDELD